MSAQPDRNEATATRLNLVSPPVPANNNPSPDDAEAKAAPADQESVAAAARKGSRLTPRKRVVVGAVAAALLAGVAWYVTNWWTVGRFTVTRPTTPMSARRIRRLRQRPRAMSPKFWLRITARCRPAILSRASTMAISGWRVMLRAKRVLTQEATIARIGQQTNSAQSMVAQARAQLLSAQAAATRAQSELDRQQALAAKDYASKQALETAQANRDQTAAGVASAQAGIEAALANVEVLNAQQQEAIRQRDELGTTLAKAERDLAFTEIRAPVTGVIGNRAMQVGDYVQVGQRLASLVPLDEVYIVANFKETQVERLRPGPECRGQSRRAAGSFDRRHGRKFLAGLGRQSSRCCRRITRPATSPRSCSVCRSAFTCRRKSHSNVCCGRACLLSSISIPAATRAMRRNPGRSKPRRSNRAFRSVRCPQTPTGSCGGRRFLAFGRGGGVARDRDRIDPRRLVAFLAMCVGMFMAFLDIQIVSASLSEIQAGLSASADEIYWVQTSYLIAEVDLDPAVGLSFARARNAA